MKVTQLTFTWSKSIIETLEKGANIFKVNNKNTDVVSSVLIVDFEHISHLFSSVSIVDFEQVNVSWEVAFHSRDVFRAKSNT